LIEGSDRQRAGGRFLVFGAGILWSLAGVFIKSLELHPLTINFYRSLFASIFFLFFVKGKRWSLNVPLLVSVLSYTAAINSFVWANKLTSAANAIVLQYTAPIFVFLFAWVFLRERISRSDRITLTLGMVGIGIIFFGSAGQPDALGVGAAVLSGFLLAVYMTNLRFLKRMDPVVLTVANNLVCSLVTFFPAASREVPTATQFAALAVMGVVQLGIPYFLFSKGLERISLQEASLIVLVEPVLNPIWVALVVGELPSEATLIGGGIVLLGLIFRTLHSPGEAPRRSGHRVT
jgi:drug/metabolite transporter (DMT)-like permease